MPPLGWKKPPGFVGYQHKPKVKAAPRQRTAGTGFFKNQLTRARPRKGAAEAPQSEVADEQQGNVVGDNGATEDPPHNSPDGLVSSRLRERSSTEASNMDERSVDDDDDD